MSIQLPLKVEKTEGAKFCHLTDSTGRAICGGLIREDAEEIVDALNSRPKVDHAIDAMRVTQRLFELSDNHVLMVACRDLEGREN